MATNDAMSSLVGMLMNRQGGGMPEEMGSPAGEPGEEATEGEPGNMPECERCPMKMKAMMGGMMKGGM